MPKIRLVLADGSRSEPMDAIRFKHTVEEVEFWFYAHDEIGGRSGRCVTHAHSLKRIANLGTLGYSDKTDVVKIAAKRALDDLASAKPGRIAKAFQEAEQLPKVKP